MSQLNFYANPSGGGDVTLRSQAGTVPRTLDLPDQDGMLVGSQRFEKGALSGTSQTHLNIPRGIHRILVEFDGLSTNSNSGVPTVQLNNPATSGVTSKSDAFVLQNAANPLMLVGNNIGQLLQTAWDAAMIFCGSVDFRLFSDNGSQQIWYGKYQAQRTDAAVAAVPVHYGGTSRIVVPNYVDRVSMTTRTADVFDGGTWNVTLCSD